MDAFFQTILPLLLIAAVSALVGLWVRRSWELGVTLFRPYRGRDPWPIGVQEDDDFKFDWSRGPRNQAAAETPEDGAGPGDGSADDDEIQIVDLPTRRFVPDRRGRIDVDRASA
jgi:hypothetical protein